EADDVKLARAVAKRPGERVRRFERRDDALKPRAALERLERLAIRNREVARPAGVPQPRVLGAAAGVIEPGGDGMRLEDLPVLVLHDRREGAVQHAGQPRRGEWGAVPAGIDPLPRRLHPDQLDGGILDERTEDPDRVRPAADAGDDALRQAPGA